METTSGSARSETIEPREIPHTISRTDYLRNGSDIWFREAVYAIAQGFDRLLTCREIFARSLDLTPTQFTVLMGVAHRQGAEGVTIKQLAEHVALAATHVTTEVGQLSRRGLLAKRRAQADRRSVLVFLTDDGYVDVRRVSELVRRVNDRVFAGVTPDDLGATARVANTLRKNLAEVVAELARSEQRDPGD